MTVTADTSAPYTPLSQILDIVGRFRDRGNPSVFNIETLGRVGVPDSLNARTLQALKVLDLVNEEGTPTETFQAIRVAPTDKYQNVLEGWLKSTYADIFSIVDPSDDSEVQVRDAFRNYKPLSQQGRMVSLFLGLCEEAGIRKKAEKKESFSQPRKKSTKQKARKKQDQQHTAVQSFASNAPPAIVGLIDSLPPVEKGWTQEEHDKFVRTFEAVLDFCYPIAEENNTAQDVTDDED